MKESETKTVRLTQYSHGAGCGCKISPSVLSEILQRVPRGTPDPRLLVGYDTRDDAAVYAIDDKNAMISTTDFFMPIVDDPFDFGAIASVNAISDVYAMGGRPITALAIAAFPSKDFAQDTVRSIFAGGLSALRECGVALLGGHTVQDTEVKFGYAVTGLVAPDAVWTNAGARVGDVLVLTKGLGTGIIATAAKFGRTDEARGRAERGVDGSAVNGHDQIALPRIDPGRAQRGARVGVGRLARQDAVDAPPTLGW